MSRSIDKSAGIPAMTTLLLLTLGINSLLSQTTLPNQTVNAGESVYELHAEPIVIHEYMIKADATAIVVSNDYIELNPGFQADANAYFHGLAQASLAVIDENGNLSGTGSSGAPSGGNLMGSTAGSFSVNESGAATYSIPITVSPGTGGMEPQLALAYSSMGQNGLLGMGWTLSGLSSISRGRATLAQDGFNDGVDFDENDRFILDGQRLMVISGAYGANGSEYRTEQNTFRKVVAYGQQGSGPEKFKVWTKDGLIFEYGYTADSRLEPKGQASALVWSVNKISDTKGNYIRFSYFKDQNITHQHIEQIEYTGNDNAGLIPYNTVHFEYEYQPKITSYFLGSPIENPFRMKRIIVQHQGTDMRSYTLYYENRGATAKSYLTAVQECGSDGKCFEAVKFEWTSVATPNDSPNFNKINSGYWLGHRGGPGNNIIGDFNGDGLSDMAGHAGGDQWHVTLSTSSGFTSSHYWIGHGGGPGNNIIGDFNGDGLSDMAGHAGGNTWNVSLSTGSGFTTSSWIGHGGGPGNNVIGDFNGDGLSDMAGHAGGNTWHVSLSTGSGFTTSSWIGHGGGPGNNVIGDFNGDGLSDMAGYAGGDQWHVTLSTGSGFTSSHYWIGHRGGPGNNVIGDFNGDGLSDMAGYAGGDQWHVTLSTGSGFISSHYWIGHRGGPGNNVIGDFDGDGLSDMAGHAGGDQWHVTLSNYGDKWLLNKVYGNEYITTGISYEPLTSPSIYTKGTAAEYPSMDFQGAMYVVAKYEQTNGVGGKNRVSYRYANAKINREGRGFRGFGEMTVTDHTAEKVQHIVYDRGYKCTSSKIRRTATQTLGGQLLSETDNEITIQDHGNSVSFSYVNQSTTKTYELDGSLVSTMVTTTQMDKYGNVTYLSVDQGEGFSTKTVSTYTNDLTNWQLGRLTRSAIIKIGGGASITNTSTFAYDATSGILIQEIIEPDDGSLRLEKNYTYDAFGNVTYSETRGAGSQGDEVRFTTTSYDDKGRFVIQTTNALGHSETKTYHPLFGQVVSRTGPNGLTTTWSYDGMGRVLNEQRADGTQTSTEYQNCGDCPSNASYYVYTVSTGSAPVATYFDVLGREVRSESTGFDGTKIFIDTRYNAKGQSTQVSDPYFSSASPQWTTMIYDLLNRVTQQTAPGGRTTTTAYAGRTTTMTNPLGQQNTRIVNALGQVIERRDNSGQSLTYAYTPHGHLKTVTDPAGNTTTMTYDLLGSKLSITTPNNGTTSYQYNAFGELTQQTNAKGQAITMTYDLLGRMIERTEPEGTSTWTFDSGNKAVGKLTKVVGPNGSEESYTYDDYGRIASETVKEGVSGKTFTTEHTYDDYSRAHQLIYPSGFITKNVYNVYGYLHKIIREDDGSMVWEAEIMNASGQLERQKLGENITTDRLFDEATGLVDKIWASGATGSIQDQAYEFNAIGNLTSRKDLLQGQLEEKFTYDELNRLTTNGVSGGIVNYTNITTYDELGNITYRSDVGCYKYEGVGPHAVSAINDVYGNVLSQYTYDANGNRVTHTGGSVTYTSFNKAIDITSGDHTLHFDYGPNRNRLRQTITENGLLVNTRYYASGIYEEEENADGVVKKLHYIAGVAIYTESSEEEATTDYLLKDHLGSIYRIVDEMGTVKETLSYDPWGKRRPKDWTVAASPVTSSFHRGFTGHEMLDVVALVHMNGRMYDPLLGRFLSADPFVQMPENLQSYNRYSYVINNPLSITDPSGYFLKKLFKAVKKIAKIVIPIAVGYFTGGLALGALGLTTSTIGGAIVAGAGFGFGSAFSGTLINGGSLGDAFSAGLKAGVIGGLSAGLTYGVGARFGKSTHYLSDASAGIKSNVIPKMIAHGTIQGAVTELQGGKFEHGFLSGVFTSAASPFIGSSITKAAIVGGTASKLGGGKFANGAASAVFIMMLDDKVAREREIQREKHETREDNNVIPSGNKAPQPEETGKVGKDATYTVLTTNKGAVSGFEKAPIYETLFHKPWTNDKYIHPDYGYEVIYNRKARRYLQSGEPGGPSFNFGPDPMSWKHIKEDIYPHLIFGDNYR